MAGTVLVSGGSGYIAGYVIRLLVAEGWTVHATIRSLGREQAVRDILAVDNSRLKFFAADLMSDAGWAEAMAGCSHVAHLASPIPAAVPKHEDELIIPAREGVLRALRFAKEVGVKRFVQTSSVAAIAYGVPPGTYTFTEADWTNLSACDYAYAKSKTIAERAARDWVAAEGGDMEFCTINPSMVLGPVWSGDFSTSVEAVKKMMDGSIPGLPDFGFSVVDVRDVADLHVRALKAPGMANERFIASGPFYKMADIAEMLRAGLGDQARRVPTRRLPDWLLKLLALFDPVVRQTIGEIGRIRNMDGSHALNVLGWKTRPVEETVVDCAKSLIEQGVVKV